MNRTIHGFYYFLPVRRQAEGVRLPSSKASVHRPPLLNSHTILRNHNYFHLVGTCININRTATYTRSPHNVLPLLSISTYINAHFAVCGAIAAGNTLTTIRRDTKPTEKALL